MGMISWSLDSAAMNLSKVDRLKRTNVSSSVASILRNAIARGELRSGSRLDEVAIARTIGVSRASIREAIRILEAEGLILNRHGQGSFVAEISAQDIREIYSLRAILEEEAIRIAIKNARIEDVRHLEKIYDAMLAAAREGDQGQVLDYDLEFHKRIWDITGHTRLIGILMQISIQARLFISLQTSLYDDLAVGISDHATLLNAIKSKDERLAIETLRNHLRVARNVLLHSCLGLAPTDE